MGSPPSAYAPIGYTPFQLLFDGTERSVRRMYVCSATKSDQPSPMPEPCALKRPLPSPMRRFDMMWPHSCDMMVPSTEPSRLGSGRIIVTLTVPEPIAVSRLVPTVLPTASAAKLSSDGSVAPRMPPTVSLESTIIMPTAPAATQLSALAPLTQPPP